MSDERSPSPEGSDIVVIGKDDTSNYNSGNILPQSEATIARIHEWLRPTEHNIKSSEYRKHLAFHLEGTGEWIHRSDNYLKWHESQEDGLLWIKGVPGSGKSVVAASMIQKLSQEEIPVLYFFFRQIVDANHRPINLLRDWLDQILIYCPELQAILKVYLDECRELDSISIDELWRHLRTALASVPKIYCVADALDEMDDGNSEFIKQLAELGHWTPSSVKVLLTSRPTANVEAAMRGMRFFDLRMDEKAVDVDISTYVRYCLSGTSLSERDQQLVKEAVPGRANGLFLYAKLAMKSFLEPEADIHETICKLPLDLDAMYIGILREHARRSGISENTQVMILQWVTHATRPLRLLELADMLKTVEGSRFSDSLKENKDLVRAACGPLLEILPDEATRNNWLKIYLDSSERLRIEDEIVSMSDLHVAALCGLKAYMPALIDRLGQKSIDEQDSRKRNPVWWAALSGHPDIIELLLNHGASPDTHDFKGYQALHVAARRDKAQVVQLLIEKGIAPTVPRLQKDTDPARKYADTPLYYIASYGHVKSLEAMLPFLNTTEKRSALRIAIKNRQPQFAKRVLQEPDVNSNDITGFETPIFLAARTGCVETIEVLVNAGADASVPCRVEADVWDQQQNVLERPWSTPLIELCEPQSQFISQFSHKLRRLLAAGADPNAETKDGKTALHCLPKKGDEEYLKLLLKDENVDINKRDHCKGRTPLLAAIYHDSGLTPQMLKYRPDCTVTDFEGNGPLHYAFSHYNKLSSHENSGDEDGENTDSTLPTVLRTLLEAGSDPKLTNIDGETPLHILVTKGFYYQDECLRILLEYGAEIDARDIRGRTPLFRAVGRFPKQPMATDILETLIKASASMNVRDNYGRTLLHEAIHSITDLDYAHRRLTEVYQYLLDAGKGEIFLSLFEKAGLDVNKPNYAGTTPLHLACRMRLDGNHGVNYHAKDCLRWLLNQSPDVNASDTQGLRAIHFAASTNTYTVDRLLNASADPFVTTNQGMNALHIAARCKRSNSLGLLLQRMHDLNPDATKVALDQKDIFQYTPLHYASRSGIIESVELLIKVGAEVNPNFDELRGTCCPEPWFPPILQCVFFDREQRLWRRGPVKKIPRDDELPFHQLNDPDTIIAAGYTVENKERHFDEIVSGPQLEFLDPVYEASRYDEIINALLDAGADVFLGSRGSRSALYRAMLFASDEWQDYITNLLWNCQEKAGYLELPTPLHIGISRSKALRQTEVAVLDDGVSILSRLVENGYYELVNDCCSPEEAVRFDDAQWVMEQGVEELEPLLVTACRHNMEVIRVLVEEKGVDINARGRDGLTALHILVTGKEWWRVFHAMPYLLSKGADMEIRDDKGCTPLLYAVTRWGAFRTAAMKSLIDKGANVNVIDSEGNGCLNKAAHQEEFIRLLVGHGAEVSPTTILSAIESKHPNILSILLSGEKSSSLAASWEMTLNYAKRLDPDINPQEAQMIRQGHPLFLASSALGTLRGGVEFDRDAAAKQMMEALLGAGFSPYANCLVIVEKLQPPFMAERVVVHEILKGKRVYGPILELADLDMEFRDASGETLLLAASERMSSRGPKGAREDYLPLRLLLDKGANAYAVDNFGRNALHIRLGSRALNDDKLEGLKDLGDAVPALINQTDADGYRPLHYGLAALTHGEFDQTEPNWLDYIITQGADMLATDGLGNNALHYLAPGVFGCLCYDGSHTRDPFERFLKLGLDINARNNAGQTPAFFLAMRGYDDDNVDGVVSWLDELGVDWQARDDKRRTILHEMADEKEYLFKAIMNKGVDPLAEDVDGRSTLDLVAAYDNEDVLKLFDRDGRDDRE
ncbi:Serine/threonine-protein phosphatase 6 regulatory ankyrin repeat subunit C [Fusarium odoratissimum]|uniref:Serine/threonine-protein phosphatase 6 regulatory ankyrin repeat subunit C n=1 Tax=Fusarium oxysporum f. sp. cubense (strain race 4) TaxID=2502994 RepID=N1RQZ3_FUSC4|nr:Serine/threonine-protein phosphatase 6 regulatory ankyrin repeat subunit C [Fusarium odoratissimum]